MVLVCVFKHVCLYVCVLCCGLGGVCARVLSSGPCCTAAFVFVYREGWQGSVEHGG